MFRVEFTEKTFVHLESFKKFERNIMLDAIKAQLPHQPTGETRHRKILRANPSADWELRIQHYRVFYEVDPARHLVRIVAIGHKEQTGYLSVERKSHYEDYRFIHDAVIGQ